MSRDGAGNFTLANAAFVAGSTIESAKVNSDLIDIAAGLTQSLSKDGQTVPTANQPMGGFKHAGVAVAANRTDYLRADQYIDGSLIYAADGGTADAYAITLSPGISAYAVGSSFFVKIANANLTTTPTFAVNALTVGTIVWPDGSALAAGDLPANAIVEIACAAVSTGTPTWHLMTATRPALPRAGGTLTGTLAMTGALTMSGAAINEAHGADIASASTIHLTTATGNVVDVTGTTSITAITLAEGYARTVRFTGVLTLTNGASLVLPGGANITTAAGDYATFRGYAAGVVRCVVYQKASGLPVVAPTLVNQIVAMCKATGTTRNKQFNVSSVVKNSTGNYTFNFTSNIDGDAVIGATAFHATASGDCVIAAQSASAVTIITYDAAGTPTDFTAIHLTAFA